MAVDSNDITHGYAVYSHHVVPNPKVVNNFNEHERKSDSEESYGTIESGRSIEDSMPISCRLSLLSSNIEVKRETALRAFLTKRLERMQKFDGNGIIVSIPAGDVYDNNSMVYFCVMPEENSDNGIADEAKSGVEDQEKKRAFLICFLAVVETGLDLFQPELDSYCRMLSPYIHKYMESVDVSEYLKQLEAWYDINICYILRSLSKLDEQLSVLLYSSFLGINIQMDGLNDETKNDIEKFMACCSLEGLLQEKKETDKIELIKLHSLETHQTDLVIEADGDKYKMSSTKTNQFCDAYVKALKLKGQQNPIKLRQIIEDCKLKVIKDMNTFNKLLKQAETDYYALYKSYAFLLSSYNEEVLMRNAKAQCDDEKNRHFKEVLQVMEQFIDSKMDSDGDENEKLPRKKAQYLLNFLHC